MMMAVMKCNTVVLLLMICATASAQQLSVQTTNNAGQSRSAGGLLLEDAVGGLVAEAVFPRLATYKQQADLQGSITVVVLC
jgi:hypothetical protein